MTPNVRFTASWEATSTSRQI